MPFSTDVNWPPSLLDIFNICRNHNVPLTSRYYGPYNELLYYTLKENLFTFILTMRTVPDETSAGDAVDFDRFMMILNLELKPVLIVQIKDDSWANEPYTRQRADTQMRQQYKEMLHDCSVPHFYGLSLLGTSLRIYRGDKVTGEVTPCFVSCPDVNRGLPSDFLEGQWDLDILSPDGFKKMQEIIAYIKAANVLEQDVSHGPDDEH